MTEPATSPEVSVLVVSYGTRDLTLRCLDAIPAALGDRAGEVIVVDNASPDDSAEALAHRSDIDLVAEQENLGFARAVNRAATRASGRYLLLLNPDAIAEPGAIAGLLGAAERWPAAGLWGGRVLDPDGEPDPGTARDLPSRWSALCFALGLSTFAKGSARFDPESLGPWDRSTSREVGYLTGCFLLVERAVWEGLGGFDERYFMYSEDADLAVRARRSGYRPRYCPDGTVVHLSGASATAGAKRVLVLTGRVTWMRAHWTPRWSTYGVATLLVGTGLRAGLAALSARLGRGGDSWRAAWRERARWRRGFDPVPTRPATGTSGP